MKYIVSRYNHKIGWLKDYTDDVVLYDRSPEPMEGSIVMPNIGTDLWDKFTYIIDNYDNLPEVAVYTKANLFDYLKPREFDKICNNTTFTPILSQEHRTYSDERGIVCFYKDGIYWERNDMWYLNQFPPRSKESALELMDLLGLGDLAYIPFAPGSGYILPRENILKHSKEFYIKLRSFLEWTIYPGEAQVLERGLYNLWK